jgi:hypothetical protein
MKKNVLLILMVCSFNLASFGQKVDSVRIVELILGDMPNSGDDIQANFILEGSDEIISFNRFNWLDKKNDLYHFYQSYRDICHDSTLKFTVKLVYTPIELHTFERYEGYEATGIIENQWAIARIERDASYYIFNVLISNVFGDLNKDGILDLAMITQDTACHSGHYNLEVFFTQPNGDRKLIISTIYAIEQEFPWGKDSYSKSHSKSELSIKRGVLWIETEYIHGHMEHKFRFQNEKFELIGYSSLDVAAGHIFEVDYNLSTGRRIKKEGSMVQMNTTLNWRR